MLKSWFEELVLDVEEFTNEAKEQRREMLEIKERLLQGFEQHELAHLHWLLMKMCNQARKEALKIAEERKRQIPIALEHGL